nr:hypothetical protein [Tanacetum cinerariifolium]
MAKTPTHSYLRFHTFSIQEAYTYSHAGGDVIYNAQYPLLAPDLIFGPDDESFRPYNDGGKGDMTSKNKLELGLYMEYQKKRVGEVDDERLKFEINTIYSRQGRICLYFTFLKSCSGIEMYMSSGVDKGSPGVTSRRYTCRLYIMLPPCLDGMCMAEYLPTLEELLESQIRDAILSVEADPVFCRKAKFLACSGVFTFLVHFTLPLQFPRQQPILMLQSSQHFASNCVPVK